MSELTAFAEAAMTLTEQHTADLATLRARLAAAETELKAKDERIIKLEADREYIHRGLVKRIVAGEEVEKRQEAELKAKDVRIWALTEANTIEAALCEKAEKQRDALHDACVAMLASAFPHPTEHPTMFKAWVAARAVIEGVES